MYENLVKQLEPPPAAVQQQPNGTADPAALQPAGGPIADLPADQAALVWIQYMRFARRESVTASRRVSAADHNYCGVLESPYQPTAVVCLSTS